MSTTAYQTDRTIPDPDAIDVYERAQAAVIAMTDRVDYPHRGISSRLGVAFRDMVILAKRYGVNEAEMRVVETALAGLIDDLYHPLGSDAERLARRIESDNDRAEDGVQDLTLIEGETPTLLEDHARKLDAQAASSRTLARVLRAKARKLRLEKQMNITATRERLGLTVEGQ
jgi:hypothetical protein